jgi:isopropylmalate/homocitrate/citramalate synthase
VVNQECCWRDAQLAVTQARCLATHADRKHIFISANESECRAKHGKTRCQYNGKVVNALTRLMNFLKKTPNGALCQK